MAAITYFVALPFVRSEEGDLIPGEAKDCSTAAAAEAAARRMASESAGGVAFSRTGDPDVVEFDNAKVPLSVGEVLTMDDMLQAAASM